MKTRLHIDRLVLKTSGMSPAAAEAAARSIAPALAEQLNEQAAPGGIIPALKVTLPASAAGSPAQMARHIANQISISPRP